MHLQGEYTFMNTQIWNTSVNRTSSILNMVNRLLNSLLFKFRLLWFYALQIDKTFLNKYANGVDEKYKEFLATNMKYFDCSKIPINEFIIIMDNFRVRIGCKLRINQRN